MKRLGKADRRLWKTLLPASAILVAGVVLGYALRGCGALEQAPAPTEQATAQEPAVWTCSMHPSVQQPEPGTCPICEMDLIPRSNLTGDEEAGPRTFTTTEAAESLMNIQTAAVTRRFVEKPIRMVGKVDYDETKLAYITAWVPGRIERMYADYEGTLVRKGDHMVDLYSPELLSAVQELRRAAQAVEKLPGNAPEVLRSTARSTLEAVRSRLRRWGMTERQIEGAQKGEDLSDRITIYAPIGGTVIERRGQEGMYVDIGERIYTIADLATVWVLLDAYESDLPWLHFGQTVEFTAEAYPGDVFEGKVAFIDPVLDRRTRTVDVRVNVPNEEGMLKPGMFVRAKVESRIATAGRVMDPGMAGKWVCPMHPEIVKDGAASCDVCGMPLEPAEELGYVPAKVTDADKPLVIPASAPLITGKRAVVYVEKSGAEKPTYEGREVVLGPKAGEYYLVERGLREGERVVTNGAFKIDSALQISAKPSMMSMEGGGLITPSEPQRDELLFALGEVVKAYLPVHEALAHDSLDEAGAALDKLAGTVESMPESDVRDDIRDALKPVQNAESIDDMRSAFQKLSNALIAAVEVNGVAGLESLYRLHCPMAFDFAGADWLQTGQEVRNPYFGSEMFKCGSVEATLVEPVSPAGGKAHEHDADPAAGEDSAAHEGSAHE